MAVKLVVYAALLAALAGVAISEDTTEETTTEETTAAQTTTEETGTTETTATETTSADASQTGDAASLRQNTVVVNGVMFATLDDAWANSALDSYCASTYANVPAGWAVAEDSSEARIAIELNSFGTEHIVLTDKAYSHSLTVVTGQASFLADGSVRADAPCPNRILLKRTEPVVPPVAPYVEVALTEYVTFQGKSYAMVDNTPATAAMTGGCDHKFYKLPTGWGVAADDEETKAVIITALYPFQYICKVTASGQGYDWALGALSDYAICDFGDMLVSVYSHELDVQLYSIHSQRCGAIMASSPNPEVPSTWPATGEITNVFTAANQHVYATLDNTAPATLYYMGENQDCDDCCQNYAMQVPETWVVATADMPSYAEAASQPWGTFCIGGVSSSGEECTYNVTNTGKYAGVRACDQRVLVKKVAVDCVSSWSEWTECSTTCPAAQTRRRENITSDELYGGECIRAESRPCSTGNCPTVTERQPSESDEDNGAAAMVPSAIMALLAALSALLF